MTANLSHVKHQSKLNRRDFLRTGSLGALGLVAGSMIELPAAPKPRRAGNGGESSGPPVNVGVIGVGIWGRELIGHLSRLPNANVHTVCEPFPAFLRRATKAAPDAKAVEDYRTVLDDPEVQAIIVATPSHKHREIAIAALEAGKHVYCEAPMAASIEDARAIAKAAAAAPKQIFQVGQQYRADPQHRHVLTFVRTGAMGAMNMARGQWNKKDSWRRISATRERERELNWRLARATSPGLMGEIGLHQLDVAMWYLGARPKAVTGFGGILHWDDGRDVPDTIQAIFEFPNGVNYTYTSSLANSFDGQVEVFQGSDSALLLRDNKAWMFREPDAPLLGWEVYARKEEFFQQSGISLVADATQLLAQGLNPASDATEADPPVYSSLEEFTTCVQESKVPAADYRAGFEAAVAALKANEAILEGKRITFDEDWFALD